MKRYISILLIQFLLFGCLNYEQITTIRGDMSGKMFIHYWTNKIDLNDSTYINNIKLFDEKTIKEEYSSKFVDIKNIEIYKDFSDSTLHTKIELTFSNIDSLIQSKAFKNSGITIKDLPDGNKLFTQRVQSYSIGFGFNPADYTMKYVYYLPGKIIDHNANDLTRNRVTWEFSLDEISGSKTLSAVFKPYPLKETPPIIYYLAGFVLLVLFIFIFRKRSG